MITPLGRPVVPDVNRMSLVSVGRTLCRRSDAAAAVILLGAGSRTCARAPPRCPSEPSPAPAEPSRSTIRRRWGSGVSAARSMPTVSVPRKPTVVTSSAAFEADRTYAASRALPARVDGHQRRAGGLRAEGGDDPAQAVGRPDRDAIARLDAGCHHRPRRGAHELAELAVRHPPAGLHDGLDVGPRRDARRDCGRDRLGEHGQRDRIDTPATPGAP